MDAVREMHVRYAEERAEMDAVRVAIAPVPVADPTTYHLELWPVRARWFTIGGMAYPVRHEIK